MEAVVAGAIANETGLDLGLVRIQHNDLKHKMRLRRYCIDEIISMAFCENTVRGWRRLRRNTN